MLLDVLIALFLFILVATAYFSVYPVVRRSQVMSQQESQAIQLSHRMLEHLQMLPADRLNLTTLKSLNLVNNDSGTEPYDFSHVPLDEASGYSPARLLPAGRGLFKVESIENNCARVALEIEWRAPSGKTRKVTTGTIIGAYR